ncbi:integrin alpha-4-like [Octopus sinensis]|uniref:Integrin alpha-4-like n=1 Tax=Octopus sinensis TaxID=2607531 RepID=A0A6P7SQ51_9MOLL|nr:integrin alpha-4-like [Octopus sinensis]
MIILNRFSYLSPKKTYYQFMCWLTILLLYLFYPLSAFNIDTKHARVYSGKTETYFGYSVGLAHLTSATNNVLIGAPKDNYDLCKNSDFSKTGVIFSCSSTTDDSCSKFCVHNLESILDRDIQNVSNAWLGVNIDINPRKEEFVTCGHRWKSVFVDDQYVKTFYMKGFCVVTTLNGSKSRRPLLMKSDKITAGGTSLKYTQDGQKIIVGVLGRDKYPGGIILFPNVEPNPDGKPMLLSSNIDNNYAGYAVASGKFFNNKYEYYVMGVPRNGSGAVLIIDETNHIVQRLQSESKEIGSYFGMKLCVADVNKDGLDDLLVGAPMEPGQLREEGQVIVYLSDGKKLQKKLVLFGDKEEGARFGSTMTLIGDIDQDGFIDIAIGAPYENNQEGAIYIYNTNKEGLPSTYSQKITGKDAAMGKDMKGFGISISDSVDVNNDSCPDFLVGAYLSNQVRLLFSRPVLDLNLELLPESQKINFAEYNCPNHGNKAVCFKVKLKFSYVQNNQIPPKIDLEGQLATGSQSQMNLSRSVQSFGFKLETGKKLEKEFHIIVKEHPNIFQPIHITIQMALAKNATCKICPILRTKTVLKKIPFELECGDDDKCTTDLKVSASTTLKYLLYQKEEKFDIKVVVSNGNNHAYNSFATFVFPKYLQYIQAIKYKVQPDFECSTDSSAEEDMVRCTLGNPLPKNTDSNLL